MMRTLSRRVKSQRSRRSGLQTGDGAMELSPAINIKEWLAGAMPLTSDEYGKAKCWEDAVEIYRR